MFIVGSQYSKNDIYDVLSVPNSRRKGAWDTGYREYEGNIYIFANIGTPGRTGSDYKNFWEGDLLHWEAKTNSNLNQPLISRIINPSSNTSIFIFTRENNRESFCYEGKGFAKSYVDTRPIKIIWEFYPSESGFVRPEILPEEIINATYSEGISKRIFINQYERNPKARRDCIRHFGLNCMVCGFNFFDFYGKSGEGFIQVHHIIPISEIGKGYKLSPIHDLIPVCANCHAMLHRCSPPLTIQQLTEKIKGPQNL
jgi:5-methylcytosine-specific restriction enzyme A